MRGDTACFEFLAVTPPSAMKMTSSCALGSVESDSVKSARKAKDKLHKACERVSETRE